MLAAGAAAVLATGSALAQTPNSIEQVSVTRAASGNTIVRFELKSPPANPPAGFATASPPRIALDFFDTTSALPPAARSCASS
jgi:type IV pilus assembly protein PilQ